MALSRDQLRAKHAYKCVEVLPTSDLEDYKAVVSDVGTDIVRHGLATTLSWLRRGSRGKVSALVLQHLASSGLHGIPEDTKGDQLLSLACDLDTPDYILTTREALRVVVWLKRAAQAMTDSHESSRANVGSIA